MAQLKFETALSRLEETVSVLEKGDLPLEEALKVFEEGIRLSKSCMKTLSEAERKIDVLIEGKDGKKKAQAFRFDAEEGETEHASV
ncbi:MAG: exodeoxyribonuclease VII small subunit [Nitrospirae bacterium]|nr:exodeoxyribonuclease VII small subunit [Candidatus Manganitrophaceae bacterium]